MKSLCAFLLCGSLILFSPPSQASDPEPKVQEKIQHLESRGEAIPIEIKRVLGGLIFSYEKLKVSRATLTPFPELQSEFGDLVKTLIIELHIIYGQKWSHIEYLVLSSAVASQLSRLLRVFVMDPSEALNKSFFEITQKAGVWGKHQESLFIFRLAAVELGLSEFHARSRPSEVSTFGLVEDKVGNFLCDFCSWYDVHRSEAKLSDEAFREYQRVQALLVINDIESAIWRNAEMTQGVTTDNIRQAISILQKDPDKIESILHLTRLFNDLIGDRRFNDHLSIVLPIMFRARSTPEKEQKRLSAMLQKIVTDFPCE